VSGQGGAVQGPFDRGPFDPGLQPERTELAWRRTALAIAIGSVISLRIFPLLLPADAAAWGLAPGVLGIGAAAAFWVAARRRQLHTTAALQSSLAPVSLTASLPGGGMLLALTMLATAFGAVSIAIVAVSSLVPDA
jgi:putative membrane protein